MRKAKTPAIAVQMKRRKRFSAPKYGGSPPDNVFSPSLNNNGANIDV